MFYNLVKLLMEYGAFKEYKRGYAQNLCVSRCMDK